MLEAVKAGSYLEETYVESWKKKQAHYKIKYIAYNALLRTYWWLLFWVIGKNVSELARTYLTYFCIGGGARRGFIFGKNGGWREKGEAALDKYKFI